METWHSSYKHPTYDDNYDLLCFILKWDLFAIYMQVGIDCLLQKEIITQHWWNVEIRQVHLVKINIILKWKHLLLTNIQTYRLGDKSDSKHSGMFS